MYAEESGMKGVLSFFMFLLSAFLSLFGISFSITW